MIAHRLASLLVLIVATQSSLQDFGRSFLKASKSSIHSDKKDHSTNIRRKQQEKEQLFEAYNLLHSLAQDFHKPFDSPAVIVVGHQTSGKSALIEALMGFQFNQVGGGTKTRRPVALRMQYNPSCSTPLCFLTLENGKEEKRSLGDIQAYIESENKRLERDPTRSFDSKEINIRMEYRYCPNMIVIDTPGMLHPPKGQHLTPQQRALAQAAREAESLVLSKIKCQDYIILCVEDTTDWKHATTRNIVMQADPDLSRTVLVTTKLDTKLPQFSEADDLDDFLNSPLIRKLFPRMLGGPFFTSVPAGRVGSSKDFLTNDMFVTALRNAERKDRDDIINLIGINTARSSLKRVGVHQLRSFLESRVEECYRRNVAKIVPLLQNELRLSEAKLTQTDESLNSLSIERLRTAANIYREKFVKQLAESIHGTVKVSPEEWGETLEAEQLRGGSFTEQDQVRSTKWQNLLAVEVGHNKHKLFGGAQYHRALREFLVAVRHMKAPTVTEDEIANAAGMGEVHDGVSFMRAACVIAIEKAQQCFEPMLEALRHRATHIMRRLYPIVEEMCNRCEGGGLPTDAYNRPLQEMIRRVYDKFVDAQMEECQKKCRDDLRGMTRFVTWDTDGRGSSNSLYSNLPTPKRIAEIYTIAVEARPSTRNLEDKEVEPVVTKNKRWPLPSSDKNSKLTSTKTQQLQSKRGGSSPMDRVMNDWNKANGAGEEESRIIESSVDVNPVSTKGGLWESNAQVSDYHNLLQLMEEMLSGRNANRTTTVVTAIVQFIIRTWTEHFGRMVTMKFNCFFLMPFLDEFPTFMRAELDRLYDSDVDEMFDIAEARAALQSQRRDLLAECEANSKLQSRFDQISSQLRSVPNMQNSDSLSLEDDDVQSNLREDSSFSTEESIDPSNYDITTTQNSYSQSDDEGSKSGGYSSIQYDMTGGASDNDNLKLEASGDERLVRSGNNPYLTDYDTKNVSRKDSIEESEGKTNYNSKRGK